MPWAILCLRCFSLIKLFLTSSYKSCKCGPVSWTWCRLCANSMALFKENWNYIAASLTIQFPWFGAQNKQGSLRAFLCPTWGASVLWGVSFGLADITEAYTGFSKFSFSSLPAAATCRRRRKINVLQRRKEGHKGKWKVKVKPKFHLHVLAEWL